MRKKLSLGIYVGWFPEELSRGRSGVRREKGLVGDQQVIWALWEDGQLKETTYCFEVSFLCRPGANGSPQFHIFGVAGSPIGRDLLRKYASTARQMANHSLEPAKTVVH